MSTFKVFMYARVSKDDRGEREQNPEAQLLPMREECRTKGWEIVEEFVDRHTGGEMNRPRFKAMMERVARKEADAVMVWKVDRFSRFDPMEAVVVLYYIREYGVGFISLMDPDASTISNPLPEILRLPILALKLAFAAMERESISMRTKAGIAAKRAMGQWKGGRPKGSLDTAPRKVSISQDISVEDMFKPSA